MDNYADALPCIVCGKLLKNVFEKCNNQPDGATSFGSHGQYGSTIFDPMDGHFLEINICDDCLTKAKSQGQVYIGRDYRIISRKGGVMYTEQLDEQLKLWSDADDCD